RITCDAARVAGINAGSLAIGGVADICVFDPAARWKVEPAALRSQGKHTPLIGYELPAQVRHTIVSGRIAFSR
ncbi:MAG: amidohydrolase family protein, partial [Betaproteobacteria bacterium]